MIEGAKSRCLDENVAFAVDCALSIFVEGPSLMSDKNVANLDRGIQPQRVSAFPSFEARDPDVGTIFVRHVENPQDIMYLVLPLSVDQGTTSQCFRLLVHLVPALVLDVERLSFYKRAQNMPRGVDRRCLRSRSWLSSAVQVSDDRLVVDKLDIISVRVVDAATASFADADCRGRRSR